MRKEDVEHLARLSRIELKDHEAESLAGEITSIVQYVSEINEITGNTAGEKKVGAVFNVMREDGEPHAGGLYTEALLKEAPERDGQYVKVKKILEDKK